MISKDNIDKINLGLVSRRGLQAVFSVKARSDYLIQTTSGIVMMRAAW